MTANTSAQQCIQRAVFATLLLSVLLLCAGCGWQLQGARHLSADLQPLYVEFVDRHSVFSRMLQNRLEVAGVLMADSESQAKMILKITKDESGHRVLSVSARNTPEEYEVYYTVEFSLRSRSGDVILQQPLAGSNAMTYDENRVLAKQREEAVLIDTMASELADQLLRQIRRL